MHKQYPGEQSGDPQMQPSTCGEEGAVQIDTDHPPQKQWFCIGDREESPLRTSLKPTPQIR